MAMWTFTILAAATIVLLPSVTLNERAHRTDDLQRGLHPIRAGKRGLSAIGNLLRAMTRVVTAPFRAIKNRLHKESDVPPSSSSTSTSSGEGDKRVSSSSSASKQECWEPLDEAELAQARIPPELRNRLQVLGQLQDKYEELQQGFFQEAEQLERRFMPLFEKEHERRSTLVHKGVFQRGAPKTPPVKDFWKTVMLSHPTIGQLLNKKDLKILEYLRDVKSSLLPNNIKGFKLTFQFEPNPYMVDTELVKAYVMQEKVSMGQNILKEIKSLPERVSWKAMQDPAIMTVKRKYKNGTETRDLTVGQSFFNLFSPLSLDPLPPGTELTAQEIETRQYL